MNSVYAGKALEHAREKSASAVIVPNSGDGTFANPFVTAVTYGAKETIHFHAKPGGGLTYYRITDTLVLSGRNVALIGDGDIVLYWGGAVGGTMVEIDNANWSTNDESKLYSVRLVGISLDGNGRISTGTASAAGIGLRVGICHKLILDRCFIYGMTQKGIYLNGWAVVGKWRDVIVGEQGTEAVIYDATCPAIGLHVIYNAALAASLGFPIGVTLQVFDSCSFQGNGVNVQLENCQEFHFTRGAIDSADDIGLRIINSHNVTVNGTNFESNGQVTGAGAPDQTAVEIVNSYGVSFDNCNSIQCMTIDSDSRSVTVERGDWYTITCNAQICIFAGVKFFGAGIIGSGTWVNIPFTYDPAAGVQRINLNDSIPVVGHSVENVNAGGAAAALYQSWSRKGTNASPAQWGGAAGNGNYHAETLAMDWMALVAPGRKVILIVNDGIGLTLADLRAGAGTFNAVTSKGATNGLNFLSRNGDAGWTFYSPNGATAILYSQVAGADTIGIGSDGTIHSTPAGGNFTVAGKRIIKARQAAIANADGTLASATAKVNAVLAAMRVGTGHGLIED